MYFSVRDYNIEIVNYETKLLIKGNYCNRHEENDVCCLLCSSQSFNSSIVLETMSCFDIEMPTQSIRAIESIEEAIMNKILYIRVSWLLSLKLDMAEKGTLGSVGAEKFRVELVPLFHKGKGKRSDGLVGNREDCEPVASVVVSTTVEVVVVVPTQTSPVLVMLFGTLLSRGWNSAFENPTSTKKYKGLIVEGLFFICDTGTALLICVGYVD